MAIEPLPHAGAVRSASQGQNFVNLQMGKQMRTRVCQRVHSTRRVNSMQCYWETLSQTVRGGEGCLPTQRQRHARDTPDRMPARQEEGKQEGTRARVSMPEGLALARFPRTPTTVYPMLHTRERRGCINQGVPGLHDDCWFRNTRQVDLLPRVQRRATLHEPRLGEPVPWWA